MPIRGILRKGGGYAPCSIGWRRRPEYLRQGAVSCWGAGSLAKTRRGHHESDAPFFFVLDRGAFRVLKRQAQLLRQRIHRRPAALPGPFRLEPQVTDAAAPRRNHAADRAEVGAIGVLLIEPAHDVGRDLDERPQRRRALDAVLPAVPRGAEHLRDLLQIVDEELPRFLAERIALA